MDGFRGVYLVLVALVLPAFFCGESALGASARKERPPVLPREYDLTYETPGPEVLDAKWEIVAERFGGVYGSERIPVYGFDPSGRRMFLGSIRKGAQVKLQRWRNFKGRHFYAIDMAGNSDIISRQSTINGYDLKGEGVAWIDGVFLVPVAGTYTPAPTDKFHWWSGGGERRLPSSASK